MKPSGAVVIELFLIFCMFVGIHGIRNYLKQDDSYMNSLPLLYAEEDGGSNTELSDLEKSSNETLQLQSSAEGVPGTILVVNKVLNNGSGSNEPSDFTIKVHGNNPSPSSFTGNATGTIVKVDMGMYSVLEAEISDYSTSYSEECSGAVMSTITKTCTITNVYQNTSK